jgi:signal transduction histidine kinase
MEANVRDAIDSATELAEMAYPPLLEARGLTGALRSAAERAGVATVLDVHAGIGCPPEILSTIYWFCVEALSSDSAGAQATISVVETDGALTFAVTGAGNHPEAAVDRLRDRIEALGGRLGLDDAHDGGSRLHGWLPLSR